MTYNLRPATRVKSIALVLAIIQSALITEEGVYAIAAGIRFDNFELVFVLPLRRSYPVP